MWDISPAKTILQQLGDLFIYLTADKLVSISTVKGYQSALIHISLVGMNLSDSKMLMLMKFIEKTWSQEIWPSIKTSLWTSQLGFKSGHHFQDLLFPLIGTGRKGFLVLSLAEIVSDQHGIFFYIFHTLGLSPCSLFSYGVVLKTQNPSVVDRCFECVFVPLLNDF